MYGKSSWEIAIVMLNAISVDVEDRLQSRPMLATACAQQSHPGSFSVEANTNRLLDLLADCGVRATFFFLGTLAERCPSLVRATAQRGHEVGCHCGWHQSAGLTPKAFWEDAYRARNAIEDEAQVQVRGYRALSFSILESVPWACRILEELGFQYDSSVCRAYRELDGNPNIYQRPFLAGERLLELPIASRRILGQHVPIGEGAYLRIFPYPLMKNGIRKINERGRAPVILHLNALEMESRASLPDTSWKSRMLQHTGLESLTARLLMLFRDFRFGTIYDTAYHTALAELQSQAS
jgi:polysaccharide deacetylase family protein (PEP-CTERM system associated)